MFAQCTACLKAEAAARHSDALDGVAAEDEDGFEAATDSVAAARVVKDTHTLFLDDRTAKKLVWRAAHKPGVPSRLSGDGWSLTLEQWECGRPRRTYRPEPARRFSTVFAYSVVED